MDSTTNFRYLVDIRGFPTIYSSFDFVYVRCSLWKEKQCVFDSGWQRKKLFMSFRRFSKEIECKIEVAKLEKGENKVIGLVRAKLVEILERSQIDLIHRNF